MEKTVNQERNNSNSHENLILQGRKNIKLEGIVEIISTSDTNINLKLKDTNLCITGNAITISRLDVELGILEANGNFECIKYGKTGGFFKKLFK